MRGHGEKLARKHDQAIVALLTCPTVPEAARAAGVSEATLFRWLQQPDFQGHYRAARQRVVEGAIASLQQAAGEAVQTLRRNLACGAPSVEVRAALGILDQAIKATELIDLEERIQTLEAQLESRQEPRRAS